MRGRIQGMHELFIVNPRRRGRHSYRGSRGGALASTTATFAGTPRHHLKSSHHVSSLSSWYQPMIWL
ncbi:hypothetical protein Y032_0029g1862 [Ancylostoma ceylanicum]|uniref:Uncharacterized protein n=1 Tax=Ancylostoma ceylanicum TaxID=53326 RepID=A0A016UTE6_9BILA|nr:hypothetical protein Y032_0029g1862 [Ancylostoma ceylanicum]